MCNDSPVSGIDPPSTLGHGSLLHSICFTQIPGSHQLARSPFQCALVMRVWLISSLVLLLTATASADPDVDPGEDVDKPRSGQQKKLLDRETPTLKVEERLPVDVPTIPPPGKDTYLQVEVGANTAFILGTEFGDTNTTSSYSRASFSVGAPLSRIVAVGARLQVGFRDYQFDGDGQFIDAGRSSGEPFDELFDYSATLGTRLRLFEGLDLELAGRAISRIEQGASFQSGFEGGGSISFLGRYQDWVVLRLGVGVQSRYSNSSVKVGPIVRLRVQLLENLWAETGGRNGRLEYTVNKHLRFDLFGGIEGSSYRLDDRNDGPDGVGKGSVRFEQSNVGVATRIKILKRLRLIVETGVALTQKIEIRDDDGNSVDESETREPAFSGRVALRWEF
jgi:hypothetical protein